MCRDQLLMQDQSYLPEAAASNLLARLSATHGDVLGAIPANAEELWSEFLQDIPNGAQVLEEAVSAFVDIKHKDRRPSPLPADQPAEWTHILESQNLPGYSVRVKSPQSLHIDDVKQYSGYIDVDDDKHFFFWFFEAKTNPADAPLLLWLEGGPGVSTMADVLDSVGPSFITPDLKPVQNANAWNQYANILFLDQPVNVGYSYSSNSVDNTRAAAEDVQAFLELFLGQFPEYRNDVHIGGISYAGHYVPAIAHQVMSDPDRTFNISSIMVGNGVTQSSVQGMFFEPMACGQGGHAAILDEEKCELMRGREPRQEKLNIACANNPSPWLCVPAAAYTQVAFLQPVRDEQINVYNIHEKCKPEECFEVRNLTNIEKFLNLNTTKQALGVDITRTWALVDIPTGLHFDLYGDEARPFHEDVADLLEDGVAVLVYAGDVDFICNWLGNEAWTRRLPWHGKDAFGMTPLKRWEMTEGDGGVGEVRNHEKFTFVRIYDAGHVVPDYQPGAVVEMLRRWLSKDYSIL